MSEDPAGDRQCKQQDSAYLSETQLVSVCVPCMLLKTSQL